MIKNPLQEPILVPPGGMATGGGMLTIQTTQNSQRAIFGFVTKNNAAVAVFDASTPTEGKIFEDKIELVETSIDFQDPELRLVAAYGDLENLFGMTAASKAAQFAERILAGQAMMRYELEEIHYTRPSVLRFMPNGEVRQEPILPSGPTSNNPRAKSHRRLPVVNG
jgi:hypothetical protein